MKLDLVIPCVGCLLFGSGYFVKDTFVSFEPILSLDLICALANFFPGLPPPFSGSMAAVAEWFPFLFELQNFPFPFPFPPPLKINVTSSGTAGKRPRREKWMDRGKERGM